MFYQGDIQSAIAAATQESKAVACFIRDESEESSAWENQRFKEPVTEKELRAKTVLLRIEAHSHEAQSLSAFCPIHEAPTLIIIKNGVIRANLASSEDEQEWRRLVMAALDFDSESTQGPQSDVGNSSSAQAQSHDGVMASVRGRPEVESETRAGTQEAGAATGDRQGSKQEAKNITNFPPDTKKAQDRKRLEERKRRDKELRQERERILRLVESDKAERRGREEERRKLVKAEVEQKSNASEPKNLSTADDIAHPSPSQTCALQVRLLDGTTIRSRFPPNSTLHTDVRTWIDSHRTDSDAPYSFKQILTPQPNRTLTISEEQETLASLGLTPSATLVLFPVTGYTNAYDSANQPGLFSKGLSAGYDIVSGGYSLIAGALGSILGGAVAQPTQPHDDETSSATPPLRSGPSTTTAAPRPRRLPNTRIRTIHDQNEDERQRRDHQFYNGNQLNFEPRNDDDADVDERGREI